MKEKEVWTRNASLSFKKMTFEGPCQPDALCDSAQALYQLMSVPKPI